MIAVVLWLGALFAAQENVERHYKQAKEAETRQDFVDRDDFLECLQADLSDLLDQGRIRLPDQVPDETVILSGAVE